MTKILDYIWNNTKWMSKDWLGLVLNNEEKLSFYKGRNYFIQIKKYIEKKKKSISIYIYIVELLQAIISLVVFIIMYKFEIQIIPKEIIYIVKYILYIFFWIFMIRLIYTLVYGAYKLVKTYDGALIFGEGFPLGRKLINFIINVTIVYWLFELDAYMFLQYNIILVVDIMVIFIFMWYRNVYDYEIEGKKITTFLSYPWIPMILVIICLNFKYDVSGYSGWFLNEGSLVLEIDDEDNNKS